MEAGERMKIGQTIEFVAHFPDEPSLLLPKTKGTVADIRDGHAYAFVIGYRWPFQISTVDAPVRLGVYPRSSAEGERPDIEYPPALAQQEEA